MTQSISQEIAILLHRPLRAAIYIRISSKKQDDGYSSEFQREKCLAWCEEHGYTVEEQYIFKEIHTGVEYRERPVLSELIQAVRNKEVDVVVVYKIDRLARNPTHLAIIREDFHYHGVGIESISEDDYSDEDDIIAEIFRLVRGYLGQEEHKNISQRTQDGKIKKLKEGKLMGTGVPLYGYLWNGRGKGATHYLLDPEIVARGEDGHEWTKGEVVTTIHRLYDADYSLVQIITYLDSRGILTPEGKYGWMISSVRARLINPFYTGRAEAFKWHWVKIDGKMVRLETPEEERINLPDGLIPPLIDLETFERNQKKLAENRRMAARNNRDPEDALCRCGIALCGYCGASLIVSRRPNGDIYRCRRKQYPNGDCLQSGAISRQLLDAAVWEYAQGIIADPKKVALKVQEKRKNRSATQELAPISRVDVRLNEIAEEVQNLITLAQRAPVKSVLDSVPNLLKALEAERNKLEKERQSVLTLDVMYKKEDAALTAFEEQCVLWRREVNTPGYTLFFKFQRQVLEFFGIKAHVWRNDGTANYEITSDPPTIVCNTF